MHSYEALKRRHGIRVSQTIDSPITILEYWDLSDGFLVLAIILVFGLLFYSWWVMTALLFLVVIVGPQVKRSNNKGIYFHFPYRKFGMKLPGIFNPGKGQSNRYSD